MFNDFSKRTETFKIVQQGDIVIGHRTHNAIETTRSDLQLQEAKFDPRAAKSSTRIARLF